MKAPVVSVLAVIVIIAVLAVASPSVHAAEPAAPVGPASGQPAIGLDEHVGDRVPLDAPFRDSTGAAVTLRGLTRADRPILLVLAYARCTMLCSVVLHATTDAIVAGTLVPGRDFEPVVISLDPRETPDEAGRRQATLLERVHRAGDRAAWPYLVGNDADIHALAAALGFGYAWDPRTEQYAHPAAIFVLTPDGRIAETLRGVQFSDLDAALERARRGLLTPSTAHDVVACFHFDPALRRHQATIQLLFRIGAAAVLIALSALVTGLLLWERARRRRG